jgi:hypothetical protein
VTVDGSDRPDRDVPLVDDRNDHYVEVELGPASVPDANGKAIQTSHDVSAVSTT